MENNPGNKNTREPTKKCSSNFVGYRTRRNTKKASTPKKYPIIQLPREENRRLQTYGSERKVKRCLVNNITFHRSSQTFRFLVGEDVVEVWIRGVLLGGVLALERADLRAALLDSSILALGSLRLLLPTYCEVEFVLSTTRRHGQVQTARPRLPFP